MESRAADWCLFRFIGLTRIRTLFFFFLCDKESYSSFPKKTRSRNRPFDFVLCVWQMESRAAERYEVLREEGEASNRAVPVTFDEISEVRVYIYMYIYI